MRDGNIESDKRVVVMDFVECMYVLCYITVLNVIYRIEDVAEQLELIYVR